jgi:O-antigen/teichoic acid export membrane protein
MNLGKLLALGSLASVAPLVEFTSRFGRTIILSRCLAPTEFGIAAALTVLMGICELSTDLALDRFLILRSGGDDRAVLAAAHRLSVARGVILAVIVLVVAPWAAAFLGAPDNAWSFRAVAGVILLRSCANLEMKQVQRDFRYGPDAMAYIAAHTAVILAVYPAARLLGDHRAMLVVMFVESAVYVAISHAVARDRYSLRSSGPVVMRAALAYGLPLSINGIGLAVMSQLDRALVSHWFGIEKLAFYTVILNLAIIPISAISRAIGQLGMSFLARRSVDPVEAIRLHSALAWIYAAAAALYAFSLAASLDVLAPLIFGAAYAVGPLFHALVTLVAWTRVCRGAPTLIMLSVGDTRQLMLSNLGAGVWLLLAAAAVPLLPSIETVLGCVLIGDFLVLATLMWRIRHRVEGHRQRAIADLSWSLAAVGAACLGIGEAGAGEPAAKFALLALSFAMVAAQLAFGSWRYLLRSGRRAEPA